MAGEDAQRPAQHHRLGLGADDEYLSEDGGQTLLREGVLALVHLLQIQVLPKGSFYQQAKIVRKILIPTVFVTS